MIKNNNNNNNKEYKLLLMYFVKNHSSIWKYTVIYKISIEDYQLKIV